LKLENNIQAKDGNKIISIPEVKTTIAYHGDYVFHDFSNEYFPIVRTDFLKDLKKLNSKKMGRLLYASHTSIRPIFSSTAFLYEKKYNAKSFAEQLKKELRSDYQATNLEVSIYGTKAGEFYQLTYYIENPELKIKTQHVEYIGILKEKTIRIIFWTIDSNEQSIFRESEAIMKSLTMQWH
ncbi:MAG: hypothetical protein ACPG19_07290, partial [Saprospiraceae bacterium]